MPFYRIRIQRAMSTKNCKKNCFQNQNVTVEKERLLEIALSLIGSSSFRIKISENQKNNSKILLL